MTTFAWCEHCRRAYDGFPTAHNAPLTRCPFPDCGGSAYDQFPWEVMRRDYPHLPEVPADGERYELEVEGEAEPASVGMYYTPTALLRVIDPAAGSGAWLAETVGEPTR